MIDLNRLLVHDVYIMGMKLMGECLLPYSVNARPGWAYCSYSKYA